MVLDITKAEIVEIIIERDGPNCCICHTDLNGDITLEHWIPRAAGGEHSLENLKLSHDECNKWKADRVPNADGTVPHRPLNRAQRVENTKKVKQSICYTCENGRLLLKDQTCSVCGSEAGPFNAPRWAKKTPKECSHGGMDWCWACSIGLYERKSAMSHLLTGDENTLDN